MKLVRTFSLALGLIALGTTTWAAQDEQHTTHHPAGAASAPASKAAPGRPSQQIALMDTQLKAMGAVHDKMMAAKTPQERNALMAEHMQAMQDAMTMMNGMAARDMAGMKGGMAAHHQMMDKRMEMMQATMQMMMDRLPAAAPK